MRCPARDARRRSRRSRGVPDPTRGPGTPQVADPCARCGSPGPRARPRSRTQPRLGCGPRGPGRFVGAAFYGVEDGQAAELGDRRLPWGPGHVLTDSEVLIMVVVGEFVGLDQTQAIFRYFRLHRVHFLPAAGRVDRTPVSGDARRRGLQRPRVTPAMPTLAVAPG